MTPNERKELQTLACKVRIGIVESTNAAKCGHPGAACPPRMCLPTCIPRS